MLKSRIHGLQSQTQLFQEAIARCNDVWVAESLAALLIKVCCIVFYKKQNTFRQRELTSVELQTTNA